jgi:hypothetical protein
LKQEQFSLTEIELRRDSIRWAQQQAAHEYHSSTSASGLYMTAYGSSRRHLNQCNANMDRKQAIDRKYQENLDDVAEDLRWAGQKHDNAVEKVRQGSEELRSAQRGF